MNNPSNAPAFHGQGDPLMEAAFASCVRWAWNDPETRARFKAETGVKLADGGIGSLIDGATGYEDAVLETFVGWVVENLWGREDEESGSGA